MIEKWLSEQIIQFKSLIGHTIIKVIIEEMAFVEKDKFGKPVFKLASLQFVQAEKIYLYFDNNCIYKIHTYQNDVEWGIQSTIINDQRVINKLQEDLTVIQEESSKFRLVECNEFPLGNVDSIIVNQNEILDISELILTIDSKQVLIKSGEVYENWNDNLTIHSNDESLLIFLDPEKEKSIVYRKNIAY